MSLIFWHTVGYVQDHIYAAVDRSYLAVPIDRCDTGLWTFVE